MLPRFISKRHTRCLRLGIFRLLARNVQPLQHHHQPSRHYRSVSSGEPLRRQPAADAGRVSGLSGSGGAILVTTANRHAERVFNPHRKDPHWGRRKLGGINDARLEPKEAAN